MLAIARSRAMTLEGVRSVKYIVELFKFSPVKVSSKGGAGAKARAAPRDASAEAEVAPHKAEIGETEGPRGFGSCSATAV